MEISPLTERHARVAAALLHDGFSEHWRDAWPTLADAVAEVHDALSADRVAFGATDAHGELIGWIGALPTDYGDLTWELHPLVVAAPMRGRGVGRSLVRRVLDALRDRGVITVVVGTDDEDRMTSVGGVDLYPGVLDRLRELRDVKGHPFGFYRRLGFEVVGVVPDANGLGRPDILLSTRLRRWPRDLAEGARGPHPAGDRETPG